MSAIKATIDADGRLAIPKSIRRQAGLEPGAAVLVAWKGSHIEIEPALSRVKLVRKGHALVAVVPDYTDLLPEDIVERIRDDIEAERFGINA